MVSTKIRADIMMAGSLGYYFHPQADLLIPGHPRLDIHLDASPTERHFDPRKVECHVATDREAVARVRLTHPWRGPKRFRVCAGHVVLTDRKDKHVEAFTLGGDLQITSEATRTTCQLTSTAPIFELVRVGDTATGLVSEFESLLARRHAAWKGDDAGYEKRLATVDPLVLYVAGLVAIDERLRGAPQDVRDARYREAVSAIEVAINAVRRAGAWPLVPPRLSDLL